jgi:hypothetical protein
MRPSHPLALAAAAPLLLAACDAGRAPTAARSPSLAISAFSTVLNTQLRALPPSPIVPPNPIYGWGNLQLKVDVQAGDACLPPNPIVPSAGTTVVAICGKIFNEGGARYTGGGIYTVPSIIGDGGGPSLVAAFTSVNAAQACRRYDLSGAVLVSDAIAADLATSPTRYQVLFDGLAPTTAITSDGSVSEATRIGGLLDGSAWGPLGKRLATDPYFAEKVCAVTVAP